MPEKKRTELSELGEFDLIRHLTQNVEITRASTLMGIGDDAAVLDHLGKHTVISSDMLVEGIHFDLSYIPLKHLGYKSVMVNLSDIYAMYAEPTHILLNIAISNRFSVEAMEAFYEGVLLACKEHNVDLVGGDTTSSQKGFIISITALGEVDEDGYTGRKGAKENDLICVSGELGGAYMGLLLMEREKQIFMENPEIQPQLEGHEYIMERFMKPKARRDIVDWLKKHSIKPHCMIDISDGLSSELIHLCTQSGTGFRIYEEKLPIHQNTKKMAMELDLASSTAALNGGEDYELLFTIPQESYETITGTEDISVIGHITKEAGHYEFVSESGQVHPVKAMGWNHTKK